MTTTGTERKPRYWRFQNGGMQPAADVDWMNAEGEWEWDTAAEANGYYAAFTLGDTNGSFWAKVWEHVSPDAQDKFIVEFGTTDRGYDVLVPAFPELMAFLAQVGPVIQQATDSDTQEAHRDHVANHRYGQLTNGCQWCREERARGEAQR